MRHILKDSAIKSAKSQEKVFRLKDGEGLFLFINKLTSTGEQGSKTWQYRYRVNGNPDTFMIGKYPTVDLKTARARHLDASKLVEKSICPREHQKAEIAALKVAKEVQKTAFKHSFEGVAREWYKDKKHEWKNAKHRATVISSLDQYVFPIIGKQHVAEITKAEVWVVIRALKDRGIYETASRVLMRISAVFDYAIIVAGLMEHNPTVGVGKYINKPAHLKGKHFPALEPKEMPAFLSDYAKRDLHPQTSIATRLLMLTGVRTTELIEARWDEIDFTEKVWIIPGSRMKKGRDHLVPLSRQTIETFEEARLHCRRSNLVFPSRSSNKKAISNNTILYSIQRTVDATGKEYRGRMTGHGFRSVFSTYLHGLKNKADQRVYSEDAIEKQLAHVQSNKVRAAYDRNQHIEERTRLMQAWADTCDNWAGVFNNVIPIHTTG